jgi:hypothetical protein
MTDDLDDLLSPRPADTSAGVREAVFRLTERRLAFARRVRWCVRATGVAAVFAVGSGVGWMAKPENVSPVPEPPGIVIVPIAVPVPVSESAGPVAARPRTARELELLAEQSDDAAEVAKLYRFAGDGHLESQDYANAARCYRLFLARAGDTALSPERGDTWLLTSLKNAAYKEKTDVSTTINP